MAMPRNEEEARALERRWLLRLHRELTAKWAAARHPADALRITGQIAQCAARLHDLEAAAPAA